jgi:hypothetical protein
MPNIMKIRPVGGWGRAELFHAERRTNRRGEPLFAFLRKNIKTVKSSRRGIFENVVQLLFLEIIEIIVNPRITLSWVVLGST